MLLTLISAAGDAHREEHARIQQQLKRPATRTYGARYESASTQEPQTDPSASNAQYDDDQKNQPGLPEKTTAGVDSRIGFILERFPPYDETGAAKDQPSPPEYACPDCDFKFRTLYV